MIIILPGCCDYAKRSMRFDEFDFVKSAKVLQTGSEQIALV